MDMEPICMSFVGAIISSSQGFDKHTISKKKDFSDYLSVVLNKNIHFDVLINNGRCRPQVAYTLRTHLKQDGIMIIRGSYEHYNVIENFYSLEESYEIRLIGDE